jgi:hypothetical protein
MIQLNQTNFTESEHEFTQKVADWTCKDLEVAYDYTIRDPDELLLCLQRKIEKIWYDLF